MQWPVAKTRLFFCVTKLTPSFIEICWDSRTEIRKARIQSARKYFFFFRWRKRCNFRWIFEYIRFNWIVILINRAAFVIRCAFKHFHHLTSDEALQNVQQCNCYSFIICIAPCLIDCHNISNKHTRISKISCNNCFNVRSLLSNSYCRHFKLKCQIDWLRYRACARVFLIYPDGVLEYEVNIVNSINNNRDR